MPRQRRRIVNGAVYHLIARFVDHKWFIATHEERELYLRLLGRALLESDWRCLAYGVMSNHIHLEAVAGADSLASWTRRVHSPFADTMNRAHDRIGPMFVRGPKAWFVPPNKVGRVLAYIHNNPVRARVVANPAQSDWTSHRAYSGLATVPPWLHVDEGLQRSGLTASELGGWVAAQHVDGADVDDDDDSKHVLALEEAVEPACSPPMSADELVRRIAQEMRLPVVQLRSRRKLRAHVLARRVVALCGDALGLSGVEIAAALGASQQCVSSILTQEHGNSPERALADRVLLALNAPA